MFNGILLIILGALAAPSLILSKKPNAQELLDKLAPYQGWLGLVFAINGLWGIISAILNLGWLSLGLHGIISWATWISVSVVAFVLGFILGYSLIVKYILSKNEVAAKKGAELLLKLAPLQGRFGLFAIILGIWQIVASILFAVA